MVLLLMALMTFTPKFVISGTRPMLVHGWTNTGLVYVGILTHDTYCSNLCPQLDSIVYCHFCIAHKYYYATQGM